MRNELKVGIFVLSGLVALVTGIMFLEDVQFAARDRFYVALRSAEGLAEKSTVKISGVKVGLIEAIELDGDQARVVVVIDRHVPLYESATARIASTSLIGSKFLVLSPGHPDPSRPAESQRLKPGAVIPGDAGRTFDEMMEKLARLVEDVTGDGTFGKNLSQTMRNLREITDALNSALGKQEQSLTGIVKNFEQLSVHARNVARDFDEIVTRTKEDIVDAIATLKKTLHRLDDVMASIQQGEGTVGALVSDAKVAGEVKETITNLKQTAESAKEVLARFTKVRAFWEIGGRYDTKGDVAKADLGVMFRPRPNKFYRIVGENLGRETDERNQFDFEKRNTITGILGYDVGRWTLSAGFFRSRGGVGMAVRPLQEKPVPFLRNVELHAEAFDLGRKETVRGRLFDKPVYIAGARWKPYELWDVGVQAEDIAEITSWHGNINIHWEDRDLAYLLGFISFAR